MKSKENQKLDNIGYAFFATVIAFIVYIILK